VKDILKDIAKRERQLEQKEKALQEKIIKQIEQKEERKIEENKLPDSVVRLDVGGQVFSTKKSTLRKSPFFVSFFETEKEGGPTGYFLDHDPKYFSFILNHLRGEKLRPSELAAFDATRLNEEFQFFKLPIPHTLMRSITPQSPLIPREKPILNLQGAFGVTGLLSADDETHIHEWLPRRKFNLLYRATRDGFGAKDFHEKCNGKGATLTVIRSEKGFIFGGFTSVSWTSGKYTLVPDPQAFLFTLINPHSLPPTKYSILTAESTAIVCCAAVCPHFGDDDLCLLSNSNENNTPENTSNINFPISFEDTTGHGNRTFTEDCNFKTTEVEVYSVVEEQ